MGPKSVDTNDDEPSGSKFKAGTVPDCAIRLSLIQELFGILAVKSSLEDPDNSILEP